MAGFERVLVICPPHLVPKWKREVEMTVPGVRAAIVESITDLERLRLSVGSGPLFAVMSREKAKLSYRWMPAVIQRWAVSKGRLLREEETGEPFRVPCCPDCTAQIVDKDGVPLTFADLNRRKHTCAGCDAPLWQADRSGPARYPLADYIKHRMKGFFDLLIGDEVHEFKGRGSAQGIAAGILADVCGKSLSLTGTLLGGYSSTIFTSADDRIGVDYYLKRRKDDLEVGTVCEGCKAQTVPFAVNRSRDLEAEGLVDEAEEYRRLADTLLRETGLGRFSG